MNILKPRYPLINLRLSKKKLLTTQPKLCKYRKLDPKKTEKGKIIKECAEL